MLVALAVGVVLGALLFAGGALSAWLSGHRLHEPEAAAGVLAFGRPADPSLAWRQPVGPPALYWACVVLVLVAAGAAAWAGWRILGGLQHGSGSHAEGLATRDEVRRAASARRLLSRSATLRPSLGDPRPGDLGFCLGASGGGDCWSSVEDSLLLVGPPRSGKGQNVVVPLLLDAPGAVVTTSTRPDNVAITIAARARRGSVAVFDPQGLCAHAGKFPLLRWSLVRGCGDPQTAISRAEALVGDPSRSGVENATFWRQQALSATRCLLHAAALDGRPPAHLYRWSHAAAAAKEAVTVLASHPGAAAGWERGLDAILAMDQRTRDSVWAMVANTFAPLADPSVLAAVSPESGAEFDPDTFLAENGTLYLLGTATGGSATATLVAALVEDVVEAARRMAARSAGQRLDPPLALLLDEAANYPLPSLPALMSDGGGTGITTLAVLQSLSQARARWGRETAGAIWDAAIVKIVLGGSANADDLADLSRLVGDRDVREWSETRHGSGGERSVTTTLRRQPILDPSEIRRLPIGKGLLLLRSAPPAMITLRPWTARRDAGELVVARAAFERSARPDSTPSEDEEAT
jgi:type IV secretion system protein VirD4